MLDVKWVRENAEEARRGLETRGQKCPLGKPDQGFRVCRMNPYCPIHRNVRQPMTEIIAYFRHSRACLMVDHIYLLTSAKHLHS